MESTTRHLSSPKLLRWHEIAYWGVLIVACAVFLVMNVLTPYKEDDMGFTLIDGVWTPVRNLGDFVLSCRNHFVDTLGRISDIFPALFAAFIGKHAFNVCNTLMFGWLLHLLSLLSVRRRSVMVLALFLAVVGVCYPVPGETMLWMAGSCNYMWAVTLSLALVYYLQRQHDRPLGLGKGVLLLVAAMVAGGFNEATSFGFFIGMCLYFVFNRQRLDRRAIIALAGYLIGVILIVASPGAWDRAADGGIMMNLPLIDLFKSRWFIFYEKAWRFYLPVFALVVGLLALLMRRGKDVRQCVWTYIFLCLTLVMFAFGLLNERAYAPWVTVAFIIVVMGLDVSLSRRTWVRVAVTVLALALAGFTFGRGVKVLGDYRTFHNQVASEIAASPSQVVLKERQFDGYSRFIKLVNYKSNNFFAHEVVYRNYYGKENVQFVIDSVYVRYHEGRLLDGAELLPATSDRPDLVGAAYTFKDQQYMVVELREDTLPATFQTARYQPGASDIFLSKDERQRRHNYGINIDYHPVGFYPLEYQGKCYLISGVPDSFTRRMVFPINIGKPRVEFTLTLLR